MKVLQSLRGQVKNNSEGTSVRPLLVSVTQSKTRVYIFTIKIGDLCYECVQHSNCNKWRTFRCKNYRKTNAGGDKCTFKMKVKNISGLAPKENSEVFWRTKSWQVLENGTASHHCCTGIANRIRIESGTAMKTATNWEFKSLNDWRFDFIEKNSPGAETVTDVWSRFNLSKDKLSSWTEKKIEITIPDRRNFTWHMTEDYLVCKPNENHSIEVFNRRDQTTLSLDHRVSWQLIKLKKDMIMAACRNGSLFQIKLWNVDGTEHKEVSFHSNLQLKIPLSKFDVNGDVVIIESVQSEVELWSIRDRLPQQIPLPICDSFFETSDMKLYCHWAVGEQEEMLVALFSTDCESADCELTMCDQIKFALVFNNFTLQNYRYRITFPKKDHIVKINLTEVAVGNGNFKTVLIAECTTKPPPTEIWTRYYYHIYDLSTGELVETLSNDGLQSGISGAYVFPSGQYLPFVTEDDLGINSSRINWNGSSWSISTHLIQFPIADVAKCGNVSISYITDTRVAWNIRDFESALDDPNPNSIVICDYLM